MTDDAKEKAWSGLKRTKEWPLDDSRMHSCFSPSDMRTAINFGFDAGTEAAKASAPTAMAEFDQQAISDFIVSYAKEWSEMPTFTKVAQFQHAKDAAALAAKDAEMKALCDNLLNQSAAYAEALSEIERLRAALARINTHLCLLSDGTSRDLSNIARKALEGL